MLHLRIADSLHELVSLSPSARAAAGDTAACDLSGTMPQPVTGVGDKGAGITCTLACAFALFASFALTVA
jgi:hypothetical protein